MVLNLYLSARMGGSDWAGEMELEPESAPGQTIEDFVRDSALLRARENRSISNASPAPPTVSLCNLAFKPLNLSGSQLFISKVGIMGGCA